MISDCFIWIVTMPSVIASELKEHVPFTAFGAFTGIIIMVIILLANLPSGISEVVFYILHPLHVVFDAMATTAMYRKHGGRRIWMVLLVGYFGTISIATLGDAVIPYLAGTLLNLEIELEVPFIEEWWLISPAALLGIAIGYLRPTTKFPHYAHVLLATWASLFYFAAFGIADWVPLLPFIFLFLFLSVWIPVCTSDIVFPLLFTGKRLPPHSI